MDDQNGAAPAAEPTPTAALNVEAAIGRLTSTTGGLVARTDQLDARQQQMLRVQLMCAAALVLLSIAVTRHLARELAQEVGASASA